MSEGATGEATRRDLAVAGRNAIKLGLSLAATWTVAFLVRFQLPRFLGPERFGAFNFIDNFAAAFFTFVELGVDTYIMKEIATRPKHASDFFGGLLVARMGLVVLLSGAMAVTLSMTHRPAEMLPGALVFGVTYAATGVNNSIAALLQSSTRIDRLAVANVMSKVLWGIGLALAVFVHGSLAILALPLLVSELAKTAVIGPSVRRSIGLELRVDPRATKMVLLASVPYFVNSVAYQLGGRLNVATIEFVAADKRELGWFGASSNLASLSLLMSPLLSWVLMPLFARAKARSMDEVYALLRRALEGLLVLVIPFTLLVSLGADLWVRLAFGQKFTEAALSLRVLGLDFVLIYLAIMLSMALFTVGKNWAVTIISLVSVPIRPLFVVLLVEPCARRFGPGGGAVGASIAEIVAASFVVVASFWAIGKEAIDSRNARAIGKSMAIALAVAVLHGVLAPLGHARLAVDAIAYAALALAVRVVPISDVVAFVKMVRERRAGGAATAAPLPVPTAPAPAAGAAAIRTAPPVRWLDRLAAGRVALLLAATYGASRVVMYASGLRFDDSLLGGAFQHLDPELLKNRLSESLFYLHAQPPVFNLFLGAVLKAAGGASHVAFAILYLGMGAALYGAIFAVMRHLGVSRAVAFAASTVFAISPSYFLYEAWLFYTMPLAFLVAMAALAFSRFLARKDGASCALFFAVVALLCGTQGIFHLAFLVVLVAWVLWARIVPPRTALLAAAAPLVFVSALYAKNLVVFGRFTASTWMGMNVAIQRVDALAPAERERLIAEGKLSDVARVKPFQPLESYPEEYREVPERFRGVPALADARKSTGDPNFNHIGYIQIADRYGADTKLVATHYPKIAARSVVQGYYEYFASSSHYWFLDRNVARSPVLRVMRRFFDVVVYGALPGHSLGVFLAIGIPLFVVYALRVARRPARAPSLEVGRERRLLLAFCAGTVAYVALVANTLNATENMRIRFMTDPLIVILGAFWVQARLLPRLRRGVRT